MMVRRGSKILRRAYARHFIVTFIHIIDSMIHAHILCHGRLVGGYRMMV